MRPGRGWARATVPSPGEAPAAGAAVQPAGHSQRCRVASAGHAEGARTWDGHGAGGEGSADPRGRPSRFRLPEASGAGVTPAGRPFTAPRTRSSASPWAGAAVTAPWRLGRGGVTLRGLRPGRPGWSGDNAAWAGRVQCGEAASRAHCGFVSRCPRLAPHPHGTETPGPARLLHFFRL